MVKNKSLIDTLYAIKKADKECLAELERFKQVYQSKKLTFDFLDSVLIY